jgi:heavy metal sensor kinase
VGRGLAPLRRVADAVSQVTARNLTLRLSRDQVPQETALIVEKLQETLTSLERTFAREKQALADISHDLRTPIASLLATTQVCLRKPRSDTQYREALESCAEMGQQLTSLVERLLALARLDAGVDTLKPESVDVPLLVENCVALVRPLAEANNLTLALERDGPIVAQADPGKLREALINLLDNAISYNRPGGRVDVAVARHNGHVEVAVRDTGIGIPAEKRARLFERFYRADPSRQSETAHAGLGLAIVKGYVELMGGSVSVDSIEGQGSTFRIHLPAEPVNA